MTPFRFLAAACAPICVLGLATSALAAEPALRIEHAWSRPTPPSAPTAIGYLTIVNGTDRADRLISVSSPAADMVEVHSMSMAGGIMRMRPVEGGVPVPAHGSVALAPDGDHLMFTRLKRPFKAGEHIPVTLRFERAGEQRVELNVEADDGGMPGMNMPGMKMH